MDDLNMVERSLAINWPVTVEVRRENTANGWSREQEYQFLLRARSLAFNSIGPFLSGPRFRTPLIDMTQHRGSVQITFNIWETGDADAYEPAALSPNTEK